MSYEQPQQSKEKKMENNEKPKIGDFVSAGTVEKNVLKQGFLIKDNDDGTIVLEDRSGEKFVCNAQNAKKVPDENISPSTLEEVQKRKAE